MHKKKSQPGTTKKRDGLLVYALMNAAERPASRMEKKMLCVEKLD